MRKSIEIGGITTQSRYKGGDCLTLVNLRKKKGCLEPVMVHGIEKIMNDQFRYLFEHSLPDGDTNLIGEKGNKLYKLDVIDDLNITETYICDVNSLKSITQLKNILNILDADGLKYIFWYENKYNVIDFNNSIPNISLKVDHDTSYRCTRINTANSVDAVKGVISKHFNLEKKYGRLHGFIMACTAVELYDGSYILHSNPVLLGQADDKDTRFEQLLVHDDVYMSYDDINLVSYLKLSLPTITEIEENYYEYSNPSFIGTILYDDRTSNDPSYSQTYENMRINLSVFYYSLFRYVQCETSANQLKFKIESPIEQRFENIIKSISVFITPEEELFDLENPIATNINFQSGSGYVYPYHLNAKKIENIKENLLGKNFYKVYEIPFTDLLNGEGDWITIDLSGKIGENIYNQDILPVDSLSHHKIYPNGQYIYNSRLHIWDYRTKLFEGWDYDRFKAIQGLGQFPIIEPGFHSPTQKLLWIRVTIKTQDGLSEVRNYLNDFYIQSLSPILSYPDVRATKMEIYAIINDYNGTALIDKKLEFKLTASKIHNFSYYIDPNLKPIAFQLGSTQNNSFVVPDSVANILHYRNVIKVSELNNPIYFANENTYQISSSDILNIASNAMRISEGQFGQYPLYVFTKEGIWALDVGSGSIVYSKQSPVSSYVPISEKICPTPFGIVFITERGFHLISGQNVVFLSPQLEEKFKNIILPNGFNGTFAYFNKNIFEFYKDIKDIIYDITENEIIFIHPEINLVYNIDSKAFHLSTEKLDLIVQNTYPEIKFIQNEETSYSVGSYFLYGKIAYFLQPGDDNYMSDKRLAFIVGQEREPMKWGDVMSLPQQNYFSPTIPKTLIQKIMKGGLEFQHSKYWTSTESTGGKAWAYDKDEDLLYEEDINVELNSIPYRLIEIPQNRKYQIIRKFSEITSGIQDVSLITRPILFDVDEYKRLSRAILRGLFYNINKSGIFMALYASNDGENFIMVRGSILSDTNQWKNFKDLDFGLLSRTTYKQFIILFQAMVDGKSRINQIDFEVEKEYKNDKMR